MASRCCGTCKSSDIIQGMTEENIWCYLVDEPVKYTEKCDSWRKE